MYEADTITAISTALGEGAIGMVRLSGPEAVEIAGRIFQGKDLLQVDSHTIHYGHIVDPANGQVVDEVMVTVLHGPKTYTRENIIEINCHGGIVAVQRILQVTLEAGARLAEPGEFTKRAFLNGRIDLSQAEAVMDMIDAKTTKAQQASMNQLEGSLSTKINALRDAMLQTLAQVEVTIDYPEYDDVEELSSQQLQETAQKVQEEIRALLKQAQAGKLYRQGIKTVIIGRPNVGKSSLLNILTGSEKAIVTDIEGTTRDTIEEIVNLGGVALHLIDTAGIRHTDEVVEQIGVERSRKMMEQADLILLVLNQAEALQAVDIELLNATKHQKRIVIMNKTDLSPQLDRETLMDYIEGEELIETSFLDEAGIMDLEERIQTMFFSGELEAADMNYLLNNRHTHLLHQAQEALDEVIEAVDLGLPVDLIQIDFTHAWDLLGEITGDSMQDELITKLFSQFCLGK